MTPLVNHTLCQITAVGAESPDLDIRTGRRRLEDSNETRRLEFGDQTHGAEYRATSRTNIYRGRSKIAESYAGLSSFIGNISLRSQTFSAQSSAFPTNNKDKQEAAQSLLTIRPALWLALFESNTA
jgi:hypothetical protein